MGLVKIAEGYDPQLNKIIRPLHVMHSGYVFVLVLEERVQRHFHRPSMIFPGIFWCLILLLMILPLNLKGFPSQPWDAMGIHSQPQVMPALF